MTAGTVVAVHHGDPDNTPHQAAASEGNSGHSTEPHLHIEAFDSLPRATADGYPLYFYDVLLNGAPASVAQAKLGETLQGIATP